MRKQLLILVLLVSVMPAYAQKDTLHHKEYTICAGGGLGLPLGRFASVNGSSYAQAGYDVNVFVAFPLKKTMYEGAALITYTNNVINLQGFFNGHASGVGSNIAKKAGRYATLSSLIGLTFDVPKKWKESCICFRFLIGPAEVFHPYLSYTSSSVVANQLTNDSNYVSSSSGFGYAFDVGIGLKVAMGSHFAASLNADFFEASGSAISTTAVTDSTGHTTYGTINRSINVTLLTATASLCYKFGKK